MIISISPLGNVGNRMLAYMAAVTLGHMIGEDVTYNCHLPEWGMSFDGKLHAEILQDTVGTFLARDKDATSIAELHHGVLSSAKTAIAFEGYFARVALFRDPDFFRSVFPLSQDDDISFSNDDLVINIRAGEIRNGVSWYPLVPVSFYKKLIETTGQSAVFLGQLDDCDYVREIRNAFPDARMIPSAGAMADFNRLRYAKHICLGVSTFSWLAAWLSNARQIHYPLLGFLHPACFKIGTHDLGGIDLAPADDPRYRFHLFPIIRGAPERQYLRFVAGISPISKEVPRSLVHFLKANKPILPVVGTEEAFDEQWYLRTYIDAAWEISEGWYFDAGHHYAEVGRLRGYLPLELLYRPQSEDISRGKPAMQSSLSQWSIGKTMAEDAGRALDGDCDKSIAFHTAHDDCPWWMVDLLGVYQVECINLFNRRSNEFVRRRATPFAIELSLDGATWTAVMQAQDPFDFGSENDRNSPYQWVGHFNHTAQFVRIRVLKNPEFLHLAAVQVYGRRQETE